MATFTSNYATANVQPRGIHTGTNAVYSVYSASSTLSTGDVVLMCKLPDNARIIDVVLGIGFTDGSGTTKAYSVGTVGGQAGTNATKFISSAVAAGAGTLTHLNVISGMGAVLDVSDSGGAKFTYISVNVTDAGTTGTASQVISLTVEYNLDQYIPGITP